MNYANMRVVKTNQFEKAKKMVIGEIAIVEFDNYDLFRSFTVQLSHYNASIGRERELFVHAASKMNKLQYCLVVVSAEERKREQANSNYRNVWKKQIPAEWKKS